MCKLKTEPSEKTLGSCPILFGSMATIIIRLFEFRSPKSIVESIIKIINNNDLQEYLSFNAKDYVEKNFSHIKFENNIIRFFKELEEFGKNYNEYFELFDIKVDFSYEDGKDKFEKFKNLLKDLAITKDSFGFNLLIVAIS